MPSEIERALLTFDRRLLVRERAAANRMLAAYGEAWQRVRREAAVLRERALTEGNVAGLLARAQWKEEFARSIARELAAFVDLADGETLALHRAAVDQALSDARTLVGLAGDRNALALMRRPNPQAVQALVGYASDGSPLRDLFSRLTQGTPERMADMLASGMAQGLNARVIARHLRKEFGVPAARALLIARTETHRAYNEATMRTFRANADIFDGWIWVSACDRRSCGACFAMHGTRHSFRERLDGHPGCRCKAAPIVHGFEPPKIVLGEERLRALPESVQKGVLGPGKWRAWQDGTLKLSPSGPGSIVHRSRSRQWGTMRSERSLRAIVGDAVERPGE